jgi:hypothetical protein
VNSKSDLKRVFTEIRRDVASAKSRAALSEFYKRAGYLIMLTHAPAWKEKFGGHDAALRKVGKEEFHKTARAINRRATPNRNRGGLRRDMGARLTSTPTTPGRAYRPTKSKYKGGASEMYLTYDLEQTTRRGGAAVYPKVKKVYLAGELNDSTTGPFTKKSGRNVHGVRIEYEQSRRGYPCRGYTSRRGETASQVAPATVGRSSQRFVQIVELPENPGMLVSIRKLPTCRRIIETHFRTSADTGRAPTTGGAGSVSVGTGPPPDGCRGAHRHLQSTRARL